MGKSVPEFFIEKFVVKTSSGSASWVLDENGISNPTGAATSFVINPNNADIDFTINKTTANGGGSAYVYDAGSDTHTFGAPADNTLLTNNPTGTVPLAVATVGYVQGVNTLSVNQAAHGFSALDVIFNASGTWTKARADNVATLGIAIVSSVTDANNFTLTTLGHVTSTAHGLTVGQYYYLSATVDGVLDINPPAASIGNYSNPVVYVLDVNTLLMLPWRPSEANNRYLTKTESTTAATFDCNELTESLYCDATSNEITVNLLAPLTKYAGMRLDVAKTAGGNNIVIKSSTGNINGTLGTTGIIISSINTSLTFECDGTNWWIK